MTKKKKKEDLKKEGTVSIAQALKDAGKIANKDAKFVSGYLRFIRRELIGNALSIRTGLTNLDSICGTLDGLRVMVDKLFVDSGKIKRGEKLFIRSSWDIPMGSKIRDAFDKIEEEVMKKVFGADEEMTVRSEHAKELSKGITKALEEQKAMIEEQNRILRAEMDSLKERNTLLKGKNEAAEEIGKALGLNKKEK